jgi:hypothetical protein
VNVRRRHCRQAFTEHLPNNRFARHTNTTPLTTPEFVALTQPENSKLPV